MEFPFEPIEGERRQLPKPRPWLTRIFLVLVRFNTFDVIPFGTLFTEIYYTMSCTWMSYYYSTYGFLLLALLVGFVTCAFTAVVVTYFRFRREDYRWWWSSLTTAGAIGGYVFLYSFVYVRQLNIEGPLSAVIFFGYMTLVSLGLACMFGFVGVCASLVFSKRMYASLQRERPNLEIEQDKPATMKDQEMTEVLTDEGTEAV